MLPHGNHTVISVKHLVEDTHGPHGYISTGVTVIRFATPDLARFYCRYMNGLQAHYRNYFIDDLEVRSTA
eukprot:7927220-Pyramimonas_sp.AAC.1